MGPAAAGIGRFARAQSTPFPPRRHVAWVQLVPANAPRSGYRLGGIPALAARAQADIIHVLRIRRHMAYKLLIAYASAGAGHARAAAALKSAFDLAGYEGSAETVDVIQYTRAVFGKLYLHSYFSVISALPWYWRYLYHRWDKKRIDGFERRAMCALDRLNAGKFIDLVRQKQPTHIICTHFLPGEILAWMRRTGQLDVPVGVVVTDYDAHRIWINPGTDHYFVASDYLRGLFISKGAPPDQVTTCGIPVNAAFSEPVDRAQVRAELGLEPDLPTVLALSGGGGKGGVQKTVAAIAECGAVQILAVAGHNERLKRRLDELAVPPPAKLVTYGFVDYMEKLMAASDLIVTKPGGMSSTECLAVGLPMVLTLPIPGQEERNSAFLVGRGAALPASTPAKLRQVIGRLLAEPEHLARMRKAALNAARPRAAFDIIDSALRLEPM